MPNKQDIAQEQAIDINDFSSGVQDKTTSFLRKPGELERSTNVRFDTVGGIKPSFGYSEQTGGLTSTSSTSTSSSTTTTSTSSSTTTTSTSTSSTSTSITTSTTTTA